MCAAGAVVIAEGLDVVAQLAQAGSGAGTSQTCAHHNDFKLAFVGWVHQANAGLVLGPLLGQGAGGNLAVQSCHISQG